MNTADFLIMTNPGCNDLEWLCCIPVDKRERLRSLARELDASQWELLFLRVCGGACDVRPSPPPGDDEPAGDDDDYDGGDPVEPSNPWGDDKYTDACLQMFQQNKDATWCTPGNLALMKAARWMGNNLADYIPGELGNTVAAMSVAAQYVISACETGKVPPATVTQACILRAAVERLNESTDIDIINELLDWAAELAGIQLGGMDFEDVLEATKAFQEACCEKEVATRLASGTSKPTRPLRDRQPPQRKAVASSTSTGPIRTVRPRPQRLVIDQIPPGIRPVHGTSVATTRPSGKQKGRYIG